MQASEAVVLLSEPFCTDPSVSMRTLNQTGNTARRALGPCLFLPDSFTEEILVVFT